MDTIRDVAQHCGQIVLLLISLACPSVLCADKDYEDKDFSVRLAPPFLRFTEVSAAGGETVANRWSSAINPASAGWLDLPCEHGIVLAPYYSHIGFQEGTSLHVFGESLTWDTGKWGTFQPTLSQIRSNDATNSQGLEFDYTVDTFQLQWAERYGDWGVGATFNYAEADVIHRFRGIEVSKSTAESYRFRLGGLYEPAEKWLTGIVVEYGFAPYHATALQMSPFGPVTTRMRDTARHFVLRPGISYEYAQYSTVFLDYQYGTFWNERDRLNSHRLSAGVDHRLLDWLFVRTAASVDARGNTGWSCGLGAYLSRQCSIDLGYQYDMHPELRPEFGRSQVFQANFSLRF